MHALALLLLIVNGVNPTDGDTRSDAVASFGSYCSAVLVAPTVALTAWHCLYAGVQPVTFRDGQAVSVSGVYYPTGGDAALLTLAEPIVGIEPLRVSLAGVSTGAGIELAGWGGEKHDLSACGSFVTWADEASYVQFPPWNAAAPGCGPEDGDSGGAVVVGERERRVVAVIVGTADATNLAQYAGDAQFQALAGYPLETR